MCLKMTCDAHSLRGSGELSRIGRIGRGVRRVAGGSDWRARGADGGDKTTAVSTDAAFARLAA